MRQKALVILILFQRLILSNLNGVRSMIILSSCSDERAYFLLDGKTYTLGNGSISVDLKIRGDPSISRIHAKLQVQYIKENNKYQIQLTDSGSKYGTFVQDGDKFRKLEKNMPTVVGIDDVIRFGRESNFRFSPYPICVATSGISEGAKVALKERIGMLGGIISSEWTDSCTALVMEEIKLTVKVVQCLIDAKPIVTPQYFELIATRSTRDPSLPLPDPLQYQPTCAEQSLVNTSVRFGPDPLRKTLFQGKTFYFQTDRQIKRLGTLVKAAGGQCVKISESTIKDVHLDEIIVLAPEGSSSTQRITQQPPTDPIASRVYAELNKLHKRPIPETDIPLAIAWASTRQYCNPSFELNKIIGDGLAPPKLQPQSIQSTEVLAVETQALTPPPGQRNRRRSREDEETQFVEPSGLSRTGDVSAVERTASQIVQSQMSTVPLAGSTLCSMDIEHSSISTTKRRLSSASEPPSKRPHPPPPADVPEITPVRRGAKRNADEVKTEPLSPEEQDLFETPSARRRVNRTDADTNADSGDQREMDQETVPLVEGSRVGEEVEVLEGFLSKVNIKEQPGVKKEKDENSNETVVIEIAPLVRQQPFQPRIEVIAGALRPVKNYKKFQKQPLRRSSDRPTIFLSDSSQSQPIDQARERLELEEGVEEEPVLAGTAKIASSSKKPANASPFVFPNRRESQAKMSQTSGRQSESEATPAVPPPSRAPQSAPTASKGASLFAFRNDRRNR